LRAIWQKELKKTKAAQKVSGQKAKATAKTKISSSDLAGIKKKADNDKNSHISKLKAANKKASAMNEDDLAESSSYVDAVKEVSSEIDTFSTKTKAQDLSEKEVESLIEDVNKKTAGRDQERTDLSTKNKDNPALDAYNSVEQAQDAWFASAKAHSLAHNRSARVQRFVKFVAKNKIGPRTIFPVNSYAEENWPHKPEEFYAEVYSMFNVKPDNLKTKSKTLYNWFNTKKYL
jgi:hypothetical protein